MPPPTPLVALLHTALADVDRLKGDLAAVAARSAVAERRLRDLAPVQQPQPQQQLTDLAPAALAVLVQAEARAAAAESRTKAVLDACADLLRREEHAADERARLEDDARAARRASYLRSRKRELPDARAGAGQLPSPDEDTDMLAGDEEPSVDELLLATVAPARASKRARTAALVPALHITGPASPASSSQQSAHTLSPALPASAPVSPAASFTFPAKPAPTPIAGQRMCRACGHAGRYKDGKCVEKWGPGPQGPGTVCDRCRKKMKRVERRGDGGVSAQSSFSGPSQSQPQSQGRLSPPAPPAPFAGGGPTTPPAQSPDPQPEPPHPHAQAQAQAYAQAYPPAPAQAYQAYPAPAYPQPPQYPQARPSPPAHPFSPPPPHAHMTLPPPHPHPSLQPPHPARPAFPAPAYAEFAYARFAHPAPAPSGRRSPTALVKTEA